MPRRFSKTYRTFEKWLEAQGSSTSYTGRISRAHARRPGATLAQLRRHPRSGQAPLSKVPRVGAQSVPWRFLSPRARETRVRALEVLSEARMGKGSLSRLSKARRISPRTVRRATGAFKKRAHRWSPLPSDRIERWLKTYEKGVRTEVLVSDPRAASLLSRYAHAVQVYLETGDPRALKEFKGRTYRDAHGKVHGFETRPEAIRAAVERSESDFGAFADLYAEPHEEGEAT